MSDITITFNIPELEIPPDLDPNVVYLLNVINVIVRTLQGEHLHDAGIVITQPKKETSDA